MTLGSGITELDDATLAEPSYSPFTYAAPSRSQSGRLDVSAKDAQRTSISCVVCAYNEADKIATILKAVHGHPALTEIIVVSDGSTDDTAAVARRFPGIRVIAYTPNRGKTYALSQGIAAARGDYLMLLDADLHGITATDIQALANPVLGGKAEVSISLRANSLALYRMIGLDFISGERMIPKRLVAPHLLSMETLPRWAGEVFMNKLITREALSIAVVEWVGVLNVPKSQKLGHWQGFLAELAMTRDMFRTLSPLMIVQQNIAMLMLITRRQRAVRRSRVRRVGASLRLFARGG